MSNWRKYTPTSNPNRRTERHDVIEVMRKNYGSQSKFHQTQITVMAWEEVYLVRGIVSHLELVEHYALDNKPLPDIINGNFERDYYSYIRKYSER